MLSKMRVCLVMMLFAAMLTVGCGANTEETKQAPVDETAATTAQIEQEATTAPEPAAKEATTAVKATGEGELKEDQALDIALKHAGVSEKDISNVQVNRELDDGIDKYEIEFHVGTTEYSYDIDAKTGDILEADSEVDDDND